MWAKKSANLGNGVKFREIFSLSLTQQGMKSLLKALPWGESVIEGSLTFKGAYPEDQTSLSVSRKVWKSWLIEFYGRKSFKDLKMCIIIQSL